MTVGANRAIDSPNMFATSRLPFSSWPMPAGMFRDVDGPATMAIGLASPVAPGAYSVSELLPAFATHTAPELVTVDAVGPYSPVSGPEMVAIGLASPLAPA